MCSSACATPEVPSTSSIEPTRTHTIWTAVGARRSGLTISVMPLASVNCWACDGAVAAVGRRTRAAEGGVLRERGQDPGRHQHRSQHRTKRSAAWRGVFHRMGRIVKTPQCSVSSRKNPRPRRHAPALPAPAALRPVRRPPVAGPAGIREVAAFACAGRAPAGDTAAACSRATSRPFQPRLGGAAAAGAAPMSAARRAAPARAPAPSPPPGAALSGACHRRPSWHRCVAAACAATEPHAARGARRTRAQRLARQAQERPAQDRQQHRRGLRQRADRRRALRGARRRRC